MVADFKEQRLSPGGCADLCAAVLFLADIEAGLAYYQPDGPSCQLKVVDNSLTWIPKMGRNI
jgi:hypothetical protein